MENEDIKSQAKTEVNSLIMALPIEMRFAIGGLLFFFLYVGGTQFISNSDNFSATECWKLEFHNDRVFKLNSCSGDVIELNPKTLEKM